MNYSLNRSNFILIIKLFITTFLLSSCSYTSDYLNTEKLQDIKVPKNIILPIRNGDFDIPVINKTNNNLFKEKPSIYPPIQILEMNDGKSYFNGNKGLLFINQKNKDIIWSQLIDIINLNKIPILSNNKNIYKITTNWVKLPKSYEKTQYHGKYVLKLKEFNSKLALTVSLIGLKSGENIIKSLYYKKYYTIKMLNDIIMGLSKENHNKQVKHSNNFDDIKINIKSIVNEKNIPILKMDTSFDVAWQRLEIAMNTIGMKINSSDKAKGSFNVSYSTPIWQKLINKVNHKKDSSIIPDGDYIVQLGDLHDHVTMQIINPKGNILTKSLNDSLMILLQNALNK
ncbi:hypothetical protein CRV09_01270 [Candidatus Pantoea edessiphila]|uniref:Outer membrane protein assembly factor BamC n=1 Tax=Candidatus Pantoea edessiphila TaxID=2044610 RepID=A0A2P5T2S9_9GAMM|nr:outer membrane protein assembly factor BamC [Candidatus Pantoea edessiphila]PPI88914.1 hypothetical protein CRV09_01270 [Candidatus Pantoea edessiphila]